MNDIVKEVLRASLLMRPRRSSFWVSSLELRSPCGTSPFQFNLSEGAVFLLIPLAIRRPMASGSAVGSSDWLLAHSYPLRTNVYTALRGPGGG